MRPQWDSYPLLLHGEETRAVRKGVVVAARAGSATLVQELQVARVDSEGLVVGAADKLSVGDVVGPGGTAVGLAGEGVALRGSVGCPGTVQRGGGEGPEVAALRALGLDHHEVLVEASKSVDLDSLEEVVGGVAHDDCGLGAEASREVAQRHAGAVDLAVVTGEEQVHVLAVGNERLVNRSGAAAGDLAREERLGGTPAVGVCGVLGGLVRESGRAPLVSKDPDALGSEVEQGRGDGGSGHLGLSGSGELVEVADGRESHGSVGRTVVSGVDDVLAVVGGGGKVLEGNESGGAPGQSMFELLHRSYSPVLGLCKRSGRSPLHR